MKELSTLELVKLAQKEETSSFQKKRVHNILIDRFKRYAYKVAHKWSNYSPLTSYDDLVQAGLMGLSEAIETFEPEKGTYFSTWAYTRTQFAIWKAVEHTKVIPNYYVPIDQSYDEENPNSTCIDVPEEQPEPTLLSKTERTRIKEILESSCGDNLQTFCVVSSRFGLDGNKPMSNQECSKHYGISPSMVSYSIKAVTKKAFKKHRKELEAMYLK